MNFVLYDSTYTKRCFDKLANVVYENFKNLSKYPELKHDIKSVKNTIYGDNRFIILCFDKKYNHIVAYLIGYDIILNDGRNVMYISYIYVSKKYRANGIGGILMDLCNDEANKRNCDGILLTCNSEDDKIVKFYENKGFMTDLILRRFTKYDVYFKQF